MNIERSNTTENEVEYVDKIDKQPTRFKKLELLVFFGCLALAFLLWCYASYLDDPIIQKEVTLNFELNGNPGNGYVISNPSTIVIYGEESILSNINTVKVIINQETYNVGDKLDIEVELPNNVYSRDPQIEVEFTRSTQKQNND